MIARDLSIPGPAGLFFDRSRLSPLGLKKDREAQARLERACAFCGVLNAGNGYGDFLHRSGIVACDDAECRARGEAWAAERDRRGRERVSVPAAVPVAPATPTEPVTDLFGAAA